MSVATATKLPPGSIPPARAAAAIPSWTAEPSRGWLVGAIAWLLLLLMIVPDNFDYASLSLNASPTEGSLTSRFLWTALLAGGLLVIFSRAWLAWQLLRSMNPFLILFAVLAIASI